MQWPSHSPANQPLHTLPPSPASAFSHPHRSSPFAAPASASSPHAHSVAFGSIPGSQPGVLGWGVGMSAANGAGRGFGSVASPFASGSGSGSRSNTPQPASVGWGSATAPASSPSHTPTTNSRRRRRSATPPSSDDDAETQQQQQARAVRPIRPTLASAKRARTAGDAAGLLSAGTGGLSLGGGAGQPQQSVGDLGKALASLDKPSLLSLLSKLLTTSPHLAPTISALLPTPSLSTLLSTISTLERNVLSAIPSGVFLREEYVWGRVRLPVEEYVSEARRFLNLCVPPNPPTTPTAASETGEDLTHPSSSFPFLHSLTLSLTRLESSLPPSSSPNSSPNPLAQHLLPALMNAWHLFLSRLAHAANEQGRIFPQSQLNQWFDSLDEVCSVQSLSATVTADAFRAGGAGGLGGTGMGAGKGEAGQGQGQVRRLMDGVRDRARREVGWLVGWKEPILQAVTGGMEGVEEEL
ncbi:hypothetical protein JCM11251_002533 [Rhodosporidiobolus azoricus]